MGAAGAAALAEALERNTAVQKVYLIQNAVGADGAAALARMMRVNSTVRLLDVTANRLPDESKDLLREVAAVRGDEVLIDLGDDDGK